MCYLSSIVALEKKSEMICILDAMFKEINSKNNIEKRLNFMKRKKYRERIYLFYSFKPFFQSWHHFK